MQALLQVLLAYPLLLGLCVSLGRLASASPETALDFPAAHTTLVVVRTRVSLARRYFRMFRFLENFYTAYRLYIALPTAPADGNSRENNTNTNTKKAKRARALRRRAAAEAYLDILFRSFNGMYLLLETLGLLDALAVPGLEAWGTGGAARLHLEAQRFWFLALVCAIPAGILRLLGVFSPSGEHHHHHHDHDHHHHHPVEGEGGKEKEAEEWDFEKERERLRAIVRKTRERRVAFRRRVATQGTVILRRIVADSLDLLVPGSAVGWIAAEPGTVGIAMFLSTILTAAEVWERCGAEVRGP